MVKDERLIEEGLIEEVMFNLLMKEVETKETLLPLSINRFTV